MPYTIRKVPNKECYRVRNAKTKRVFARCSTRKNAEAQVRLLRAIENNKNFVLRDNKRRVPKALRNKKQKTRK